MADASRRSPIYREKTQTGLRIVDRDGKQPLYAVEYPARVYREFSEIPPLVVNTLLFIEDRHLLETSHSDLNPAVDWLRLARALANYAQHQLNRQRRLLGASTLVTQLDNLLRVQTDNYNQPLSIDHGTRLELGSTAKLRTPITYLEIVEQLHDRYGMLSPARLRAVRTDPGDSLTKWALAYLSTAADRRLTPMLKAALERKYSASPAEGFFTGAGCTVSPTLSRRTTTGPSPRGKRLSGR